MFLMMLSGVTIAQPLTGTKTIPGDYATISAAVTALSTNGVGTGGVTFNILPGTYTGQITVPAITGSSISNPIVFQSSTNNQNDVIIQATPTSAANYVWQFNGADYISIKNMTFQLTGTITSYAVVINGIGLSDGITIYGNKIIGVTNTSTGTAYAAIYFNSGTTNVPNYTTIQNNIIQNGSYGIYFYGGSSTVLGIDNQILGNIIENYYNYGIYAYGHSAIKFEDNTITGRGTYSTEYGLYMAYNDNASTVLRNKIHTRGTSTSYALYPYYCDGASGQEVLIANNFVTISQSTGTAYGLYCNNGNYQKIYHNSVNVTSGSATGGIGMYFYVSSATGAFGNIDVRNNVSVNTGGGYAVGIVTSAVTLGYVTNMDYNDYYASGTNLGLYGTAVTDLSAWQIASGKDANSISIFPGYLSLTDLHASGTAMNGNCPLLTEVPDDIDGQPRNNPTDMGADEFTPQVMTLTSINVSHPSTAIVMAGTNNNGILKLDLVTSGSISPLQISAFEFNTNGCTNALNDLSNAKLWSSANLDNFNNASIIGNVVIDPNGMFMFDNGTGFPVTLDAGHNYLWLTYDIKPTASAFNVIDAELTSVTINGGGNVSPTNGAPVGSRIIRLPLVGSYTINNTLPTAGNNYNSFTAAVTDLNSFGVGNGGVTFNVASGTYNEQISISEVANTSIANPIVFQSNTSNPNDVILQFTPTSTNNYVVQFNGTDHITFKNMTIQVTGAVATYANVFNCIGMSDGITIFGNKIIGWTSTGTATALAPIFFGTGAANMAINTTIQNNIIQNGSYAIYIYGSTATALETGNKILGNTIENFYYYGIYSYYQDAIRIEGNTIEASSSAYTTQYGLYMGYNDNASRVLKNKIHVRGTSTSYALYLNYIDGALGQEALIANNFIVITNASGTAYGLYSYYGNYQKIYHNSVNVAAGSATAGYGMYFYSPATGTYGNIDVQNNVSVNTGGGYAVGIYSNAVTLGYVSIMDYNNYYATGTNLALYGTAVTNLSAWQTASNKDANSLSLDPGYISATNLHATGSSVNNTCPLLADVLDDIDVEPRNALTDMGADEYTPVSSDIALLDAELVRVGQCLNNNDSIYITIKNNIGNTMNFSTDPITINWFVNGPVNSSGSILLNSGTLGLNNELTFGGDGVNMSISGNYTLEMVYIDANAINLNQLNDTIFNTSNITAPVFNFIAQPGYTLITDNTTTVPITVNSNLFPGGDFFITEVAQYKYTTGAPTAGWPTYLVADDYIEITGVPGSDLNGYTLEQWDASSLLSTHTFPLGTVLGPNGTAIIAVGQLGSSVPVPASYYYHGNGSYTGSFSSSGTNGRILKNPSGNIIDAVGYGAYTFPTISGVTSAEWSGNTPSGSSTSGNRLVGPHTKDATNWINSSVSPQDPNVVNTGVTVPLPGSLTGFSWSLNGNVINQNVIDSIVGPFTVNGIYNYIASYTTTCGIFTDTAVVDVLIPQNDLKALAITSPAVEFCYSGTEPVSISITNLGTAAVNTPFTAYYNINGGTPVSETVNLVVNPLDTVNYTFTAQANLPSPTADVEYLITAWTTLTGDPFQTNDTVSKTVTSGYVPPAPTANNINTNYAQTAYLVATPSSTDTNILWYQNLNDTVFINTGLSYTTPVLYDTVTYYLASGGGKADLKITELAINKSGTGVTPVYPSWAPGADLFEITNLGNAKVNMLGYKFYIYGATNPMNYTFPSVDVNPGEIVILCSQTGTDDYAHRYFNMGGSTDIQSATVNGYVLKAPDNTVIDAVAVNSYAFAAGEASASDWSGNLPSTSGLAGPIRVISDNNVASDWIVSSAVNTQTIGSLNPGLSAGAGAASCQSNRVPIKAMISNYPAVDAGISNLILPTTTVNGGSSIAIKARIKNYGLNNLTSATIGWSINGVIQTPVTWTGNVARKDTSAVFNIANYSANTPGMIEIKTWSYNPNGTVDNYAVNDTANGSLLVNLVGNYTIGTSGANFTTINEAVNLLNTVGIGSNVIFSIKPGTYKEKLLINQIEGANSTKSVTFQSQNMDSTSVIISDSSLTTTDNYTIRLNGTDYISFKNLTVKNEGVTYGRVFDLLGGTNFINIANSIIESSATGTASTTAGIYSASGIDSNIVIENNIIKNGYYGIFLSGTSTTVKESNNIIRNNTLIDFYYYGIYSYYQYNTTITNNYLLNRANASNQYGMSSYYNDNATITKNQIYLRGNGSGTNYGVYMYYNNNTTGSGLFANNFIAQSNGTGTVYGIYNTNTKNTKYFYNSISITKGTATVASNVAFYNTGTTTGTQLLNNIFSNTGGGYAIYYSSTILDSSNNNCLYASGTNLAYWSAAKTDLAALQAASGRDANSISVYPLFVDSIADLHATNAALTEKATSVPEVSDDIDGQLRSILPTIGADEFVGSKTLNVTVFLEGLYNGAGGMNPVQDELGDKWSATIADKITIELHNSSIPSITEATFTNQDLSTNGTCSVNIPFNIGDSYYIVIKHRNSIQTWSAIPMAFNTSVINYNFSIAASQAYADNQKQLAPGLFGLFVGDVNQDEVIDLSDLVDMDVDLTIGTVAYTVYDLNGDGVVDLSDLVAIDESLTNGVVSMYP